MLESSLIRILPACLTAPLPKGWDKAPEEFSIEVMPVVERPEVVVMALRTTEPDILLLDADFPEMDAFALTQQALAARPGLAVMLVSQDSAPDRLRRAMLSGAEEYLIKPVEAGALRDSILNVASHKTLRTVTDSLDEDGQPSEGGLLVGIVSGKGGLGKTTLAVNLAAVINRVPGKTASLVGLESGDGAVLLSIQPRAGLMDMAASTSENTAYSPDWLKQFATKHNSGLHFWSWQGVGTPQGTEIPDDFLTNVFDTFRRCTSITFVDFPLLSADEIASVLPLMDIVIVVSSSSDLLALRSTKTFLEQIPSEIDQRVRVVINRASATDMINREDFEQTLQHKVAGSIPEDAKLAAQSINMGSPFVISQPQSELACSVRAIAQSLFKVGMQEEKPRPRKIFSLF